MAACEADVERNAVLPWLRANQLGIALAYCSAEDQVLPWGNTLMPSRADSGGPGNCAVRLCRRVWSLLAWPYGSLGRTGWLFRGAPVELNQTIPELYDTRSRLLTHWQTGGHSTWFSSGNIEPTFEQFYSDLQLSATH